MSHLRPAAICLLATITMACVSQPATLVKTESARTYDGLYPVEHVQFDHVWARADLDLSGYEKIFLESTGIQYRPVSHSNSASRFNLNASEFPLNDAQKKRLEEEVAGAFNEELAKSKHFTLAQEPASDTLIVRGGLIDVVSKVPPERFARSDVYLDEVGAATLVIELVDPLSHAVLLRAVDRRAADTVGTPVRSSPATNWQEVRRLARTWARTLRAGLDGLHERMTLE